MSDNINKKKSRKEQKGAGVIENGLKILHQLGNINILNVPMHAIIVPAGLTFAAWHTRKSDRFSYQKGGGAGNVLFGENTILQSWMNVKNLSLLNPNTMIPLGVLILIYNVFDRAIQLPKKRDTNDNMEGGGEVFLLNHPLVHELIKIGKFSANHIMPSLLVPFALLMGRDVYKAYLLEDEKKNKK